jgi:hypothetical protein
VTINTADFLKLCDNLGFGGATISSPEWNQMLAFADSIGVDRTLVPEPASAGPILLVTAGRLLARQRRGRTRRDRHATTATPTMATAGRMPGRCDQDHPSAAGIFPRGPRSGVTLSPAVDEVQHVCHATL